MVVRYSTIALAALFVLTAAFGTSVRSVDAFDDEVREKLAVPVERLQQKARRLVRELHVGVDKAGASRQQKLVLARKLLAEGVATNDDPAGRHALFSIGRELAEAASDVDLAFQAIDLLDQHFEIDALSAKISTLTTVAKSNPSAGQNERCIELGLATIDIATAAGDFVAARQTMSLTQASGRKARNLDFKKRIAARGKLLDQQKRQFNEFEAAMTTLTTEPTDQTASRIVGKYRCFVEGDWSRGFPLLLQGDDDSLRSLARRESIPPSDGPTQVALADAWWAYAEDASSLDQLPAQRRAAYWYRFALPSSAGLVRTKLERRLQGLPNPGAVVRKLRFDSIDVLGSFVGPVDPSIDRTIIDGRLLISSKSGARSLTTYREGFKTISSVTIRGFIVSPSKHNFRLSVGRINAILNWELADQNEFRNLDAKASTAPAALMPGVVQTIQVKQVGDKVQVLVDDKVLYETAAQLDGAVTIYGVDNTIAIEEIVIEGVSDPSRFVEGPSHPNAA